MYDTLEKSEIWRSTQLSAASIINYIHLEKLKIPYAFTLFH